MLAIQNFLASIGELFLTAFHFLLAMFKDFFDILKILARIPDFVFSFFSWFPPEIYAIMTLLISVIIIYKILGREG